MFAAKRGMNDHRLIARQHDPWERFVPGDARKEHIQSRAWLIERLGEPFEGKTIIVTHHVPHSIARHPGFEMDGLAPAFYSDCDDLIEAAEKAEVSGWIFGHHHWSGEWMAGGVKLLSAQPGYKGERTNWTGPGILDV